MSNNNSFTKAYEDLPQILKVILHIIIPIGYIISGVYRILRYLETKNIVTLVIGILCFFGLGFIFTIIDFITELTKNKITVLAD